MESLPFLVPIVAIIMGCLIAIIAIVMSSLERRKYYDAVMKAVESGKSMNEIKELLGRKDDEKDTKPSSYLYRGIFMLGVGVGIVLFGVILKSNALAGGGVFIGVIGLSFLVIFFLQPKINKS